MVLSQAHGKPSNTNTDAIHVQDDAIKPTCANDEEKNEELDVDNDSKPAALPIKQTFRYLYIRRLMRVLVL